MGYFCLSKVPWSHIINNSSFQLNSYISKTVAKDKNNKSALLLKNHTMKIKPRGRGFLMCVWLYGWIFFSMGRKSSESLLWKYLGLAQLLQTTVPFTKANSDNVLKSHSDRFRHHFLMGLSHSRHHPRWRTDPYLLKLRGELVFPPLLVRVVWDPQYWKSLLHMGNEAPGLTEVSLQAGLLCTRVSHPRGLWVAPVCGRFITELLPTPLPSSLSGLKPRMLLGAKMKGSLDVSYFK